ncbi:MAG: glycosyl transferase family 1, partial [Anaerolineae bacterium]
MARLLILTPQLPFPPHQGTTIRNFNLIAGLAPRHDIDLLSLMQPTDLAPAQTPLPALCRQVIALPAPPPRAAWRRLLTTISTPLPDMALRLAGVRAFQDTLLNLVQTTPYAVLQVEGIEMAPYVTWLQRQPAWASARQAGHLRLVFDDHNAETILQQRTALADLRHPARWAGAAYS